MAPSACNSDSDCASETMMSSFNIFLPFNSGGSGGYAFKPFVKNVADFVKVQWKVDKPPEPLGAPSESYFCVNVKFILRAINYNSLRECGRAYVL